MSRFGLFQFAGLHYAVPLSRLLRIKHHAHCFLLPKLPHGVMSVLVDDRRLVPLLNLRELLFEHGAAVTAAEYAVLIETEAGIVALPADATAGIVPETKGQISDSAEMNATAKSGEFIYQQNTFVVLDVDILIMSLIQALQKSGALSRGAGRHQ